MVLIEQPASALQRESKVGMPALLSLVDIALCSAPAQQQQQRKQQRWRQAPQSTGSAPRLLSTPSSPVLKGTTPQAVRRPKSPQPQLQTFSQLSVDRHRRKLSSSTLASALGGSALRADRSTSRSDRPMSSSSPLLRASPGGGRYAHLESMCEARPCARSEAQARRSQGEPTRGCTAKGGKRMAGGAHTLAPNSTRGSLRLTSPQRSRQSVPERAAPLRLPGEGHRCRGGTRQRAESTHRRAAGVSAQARRAPSASAGAHHWAAAHHCCECALRQPDHVPDHVSQLSD